MKQFCLTPAASKRLIGKAMVQHPEIQRVLKKGTLLIIAGTTNGYVAEEVLESIGQGDGFSRKGFRRGMVTAPGANVTKAEFAGDVVTIDGEPQAGRTIFDAAGDLKAGDVVLKGGNALDPRGQAAVLIGHPEGGTILPAMSAVVGRKAKLIVPIGLEKRVAEDVNDLAKLCNSLKAQGPRLYPVAAETFTEMEAIKLLSGAKATLIASGGVYGAEGSVWLGIAGTEEQLAVATELMGAVMQEPRCEV
jgi:hypothetical protein